MLKGFAAYVLPCFENYIYITIDEGDMFGHVDFVMHKLALEIEIMGENYQSKSKGKSNPSDLGSMMIDIRRVFSV